MITSLKFHPNRWDSEIKINMSIKSVNESIKFTADVIVQLLPWPRFTNEGTWLLYPFSYLNFNLDASFKLYFGALKSKKSKGA